MFRWSEKEQYFDNDIPVLGVIEGRDAVNAHLASGVQEGGMLLIGVNMIRESFEKENGDECDCKAASVAPSAMIVPAIATSIDALAIGIAFAVVEGQGGVSIFTSVAVIGIITMAVSAVGVEIGGIFGNRFKHIAERAGGIILIIIGFKIVLEHLGALAFFGIGV